MLTREQKEKNAIAVKAWREKNRLYWREHQRAYYAATREARLARQREYRKEVGTSGSKYPERYKARTALNNAVRDGRIVRPSYCSCCLAICKPHGHHPDYQKPLEVIWLCNRCHISLHSEESRVN